MRRGAAVCRTCFAIQVTFLLTSASVVSAQFETASKWAMDDDEYSAHYKDPYSTDLEVRRRQIRQERWDADFQEGNYGISVGGGGFATGTAGGSGQIDYFRLPTSWSTYRIGAIASELNGEGLIGGDVDIRVHTPTRLAPYIGLEGAIEINGLKTTTRTYGGYSYPRKVGYLRGIGVIAPEAGLSYWVNKDLRLNLGCSYDNPGSHAAFVTVKFSVDFALRQRPPYVLPPTLLQQGHDPPDPYFYSTTNSSDVMPKVQTAGGTLADTRFGSSKPISMNPKSGFDDPSFRESPTSWDEFVSNSSHDYFVHMRPAQTEKAAPKLESSGESGNWSYAKSFSTESKSTAVKSDESETKSDITTYFAIPETQFNLTDPSKFR